VSFDVSIRWGDTLIEVARIERGDFCVGDVPVIVDGEVVAAPVGQAGPLAYAIVPASAREHAPRARHQGWWAGRGRARAHGCGGAAECDGIERSRRGPQHRRGAAAREERGASATAPLAGGEGEARGAFGHARGGLAPGGGGEGDLVGTSDATGKFELDEAIVRRHVKRAVAKLAYCYEKELLAKPSLGAGVVFVSFVVAAEGGVTSTNATGTLGRALHACVGDVITAIQFPAAAGATRVDYAIELAAR